MKKISARGDYVILFVAYVGHGAEIYDKTHAVMSNGRDFVNLSTFV